MPHPLPSRDNSNASGSAADPASVPPRRVMHEDRKPPSITGPDDEAPKVPPQALSTSNSENESSPDGEDE
jgi:hypothetical protein